MKKALKMVSVLVIVAVIAFFIGALLVSAEGQKQERALPENIIGLEALDEEQTQLYSQEVGQQPLTVEICWFNQETGEVTRNQVPESDVGNWFLQGWFVCPPEPLPPPGLHVVELEEEGVVREGSIINVFWNVEGAMSCDMYGNHLPIVGGGVWTELKGLPSLQRVQLYALDQRVPALTKLQIGINCTRSANNFGTESVFMTVTIPLESDLSVAALQRKLIILSDANLGLAVQNTELAKQVGVLQAICPLHRIR